MVLDSVDNSIPVNRVRHDGSGGAPEPRQETAVPHGSGRRTARRSAIALVLAGLATLALAGSASATGKAVVAGPGATAITVDWQTVARTRTTESLWVQVTGATAGKVNSCGTGMSIWYNDARGTRRNLYQARDYCLWGPVWSYWTPTFAARRGTCVQATYRMDMVWRNATTFCIK
jgi:hypothetical protein